MSSFPPPTPGCHSGCPLSASTIPTTTRPAPLTCLCATCSAASPAPRTVSAEPRACSPCSLSKSMNEGRRRRRNGPPPLQPRTPSQSGQVWASAAQQKYEARLRRHFRFSGSHAFKTSKEADKMNELIKLINFILFNPLYTLPCSQ